MQVFDIKTRIDFNLVKKIFSNSLNAKLFLKASGCDLKPHSKAQDIFNQIVLNWDYEKARPIIRKLFTHTNKFKRALQGSKTIEILLDEWQNLGFGKVEWPFSQGAFDNFVQSINHENTDRMTKDSKVKNAAFKYRRIKEINTKRNDFLESLIFLKNDNIIPTLAHTRGVDFFINGISFDQKVSRSVTNEFKKDFGVDWKKEAINNPHIVANYLYTYQDEGRFGSTPRLFIVYLDENISAAKIEQSIKESDLDSL